MQPNVRQVAQGKWRGILVALGFQPEMLSGKHQPCPACGGTDRFRFDDKNGAGSFYCSVCGAGDGVQLVMRVKDWDFATAAREIEKAAGFVKPEALKPAKSDEEKVRALRRVWQESLPITEGDEAYRYLVGRGLPVPPKSPSLRFHPRLAYRDGDELHHYPAMIALVTAPDGSGATIHRTYLKDGKKAPVASPKKIMPGLPLSGAAVRLSPVGECLGIAEGIETAMAASERFSIPTWSCISAAGMESFIPPEGVKQVWIFADNDANFTGQKAAYVLAHRLALAGIAVRVEIPDETGKDWADL